MGNVKMHLGNPKRFCEFIERLSVGNLFYFAFHWLPKIQFFTYTQIKRIFFETWNICCYYIAPNAIMTTTKTYVEVGK